MGFNFSAFVGGAAKGLADVVTEQRKDFDDRTDKYLDFSISRGLGIMDERKKERKDLMFLGRNLKKRGLSDDQVSLVLDTGLTDGQAFLKSVQEKESKTGKMVDAGALVEVSGKKPTGMAWEDYLDKAIMGTYATGDPYKSMPVAKDTSILGGMFSGGDEARKQAIHSRANLAGGSTGQDVGNILAASNNEVQYDRDVVAEGFVRMAGDVTAITNLQATVVNMENMMANTDQLKLATSVSEYEFDIAKKQESLDSMKRKVAKIEILHSTANGGEMITATLDAKLDLLQAQAKSLRSPKSYQEQQVFIGHELAMEMNSQDPDQDLIKNLEDALLKSQTDAATYFGIQRTDGTGKTVSHSALRQLYNDLVVKHFKQDYPAGKDNMYKLSEDGTVLLNSDTDGAVILKLQQARATAYSRWQELMAAYGTNSPSAKMLDAALDPNDKPLNNQGLIDATDTPTGTLEERIAALQAQKDAQDAANASANSVDPDFLGYQQSGGTGVVVDPATTATAATATAVVVKEEVKPEEVTKVVPIDLTPVELGKAYNAGELKPDIYYTTTNRNGTTSTRLGSEIMSDLAKITGTKVKPKLTAQDKRGFLGEGIEDTVVPAITKVGKAAVNKISGLFNIDPITSAAESKLAPYVYKKPIEEAAFNSGNRTAKSSIIRNSTKAKIDIFQEGRAKEAANLLAVLLKFDVTDLRDDTQDKHEANIADLRAFIAKSKK